MHRETNSLQLPDGRQLAYAEYGDPAGIPVIYHHGFPGSRLEAALFDETARQNRLRIIVADRNGIGRSDPKPQRRLIDWPMDMANLADHLKIERFYLIGISGGGPYAIACAHQLAHRVVGLSLVCPLGRLDLPGMLESMQWPAQINFRAIRMAPWLSHIGYRFGVIPFAQLWPAWIYQMMVALSPQADKTVLNKPSVRAVITDSLLEAIRQGDSGILDEMALYTRPWGFDPSEIDLPVQLWHGSADTTVPILQGRQLAQSMSHCTTNWIDGEGHFSLPFEHMEEIIRQMIAPSNASDG